MFFLFFFTLHYLFFHYLFFRFSSPVERQLDVVGFGWVGWMTVAEGEKNKKAVSHWLVRGWHRLDDSSEEVRGGFHRPCKFFFPVFFFSPEPSHGCHLPLLSPLSISIAAGHPIVCIALRGMAIVWPVNGRYGGTGKTRRAIQVT